MTREYRSGDPLRRVHWPVTARQGKLMVRAEESVTAPRPPWCWTAVTTPLAIPTRSTSAPCRRVVDTLENETPVQGSVLPGSKSPPAQNCTRPHF
ncbi:DUF58 domain-containing protein [Arthrobacter alpinus]|nr:DUF58 domain-containing protein [Arthrobacter alpinus]